MTSTDDLIDLLIHAVRLIEAFSLAPYSREIAAAGRANSLDLIGFDDLDDEGKAIRLQRIVARLEPICGASLQSGSGALR
jgi:hypothetical protein